MTLNMLLTTSSVAVWDALVLVGAGGSSLSFDRESGELVRSIAMPAETEDGPVGDVVGVAVDEGIAYLATSGGCIAAFDMADGSQRWLTTACPVRPTGGVAQLADGSYEDLLGAWDCTEIAVRDDAVAVGFSSFQMEDSSTFVCVEADTGEVRWSQRLDGRFDAAGGIGYPVAIETGLLTPMPDGSGIGLFDIRTGELLDRVETDSEVYMGLTCSADGGLPCYAQSRLGTLYKIWIEDGKLVAERTDEACRGADLRVPSGARPVLVDDLVVVNAATQAEDAERFEGDYDPSQGAWVVCDAETLEPVRTVRHSELESTPVVVGESLYYLGRAGVYGSVVIGDKPEAPELVFDGEGRDRDVWEQQLLYDDGRLFFVGGEYGKRRLFALSL